MARVEIGHEYKRFGTRVVKASHRDGFRRPVWDVHNAITIVGSKGRPRVSALTATGAVIKVFLGQEN